MAHANTAGTSVRHSITTSAKLAAAIERYCRRHKITEASEFFRRASAAFLGDPALADMPKPGRPKGAKNKSDSAIS